MPTDRRPGQRPLRPLGGPTFPAGAGLRDPAAGHWLPADGTKLEIRGGPDPETAALSIAVTMLERLDEAGRRRCLNYLFDRYMTTTVRAVAAGDDDAEAPPPGVEAAPAPGGPGGPGDD
jgi:hypothetical protein